MAKNNFCLFKVPLKRTSWNWQNEYPGISKIVRDENGDIISEAQYDPDKAAIVLRTDFRFDKGNVSGFLFLITSQESVTWLKNALTDFLEQYEWYYLRFSTH